MLWTLISFLYSFLWFIYFKIFFKFSFCVFVFLFITSLIGLDTGFHSLYIQSLLDIFDYVRKTIESRSAPSSEDDQESEEEEKMTNQSADNQSNNNDKSINSDTNEVSMYQRAMKRLDEQSRNPEEFKLDRVMNFVRIGITTIIDDDVTKRFKSTTLATWNLLTRTNKSNYQFLSFNLFAIWFIGFWIRFFILFPLRMIIMSLAVTFLIITNRLIGLLPESPFKRFIYRIVSITTFRMMARTVGTIVRSHDKEYMPKSGGICVANHTSPFDIIILSCDNAYALVGQKHTGVLGLVETSLNRATSHVFFDRFQASDRSHVTEKLKEHASDKDKLPILIFPEGTCINNSAVLMFKKGAFEASDTIYPVAMKYDPRFGDAFWDSSKYGFASYMLMMMTSWAIVVDLWYLPPMKRQNNESAIEFANRTKHEIAKSGGLVDSEWDGQLKRMAIKGSFKEKVQEKIAKTIS